MKGAVASALRVVRILDGVIRNRRSLEDAWRAECSQLGRSDAATRAGRAARDVCAGTLRHLHYYAQEIDASVAPVQSELRGLPRRWSASADVPLLALLASNLYQRDHPHRRADAALRRHAVRACDALERPWGGEVVRVVCSADGSDAVHTDASRLSLPKFLHDALRDSIGAARLAEVAAHGMRRPTHLGLNLCPRAWPCRDE